MKSRAGCLFFIIFCLACWTAQPTHADAPADKKPIRIGMAQTMVVDVPQALVDLLGYPFAGMMKEFTGLEGKLEIGGGAFELARKVDDGELHLGVFQGVEYAWVQSKHPNLKPLMTAVYQDRHLQAQLFVHKKSEAKCFADLRGKNVAYPKKSKEHCRVFMERWCSECGDCVPRSFFSLIHPGSVETAFDHLLESKCDAVVVDKVSAEFYRHLKPGAFNQFRLVKESERFPAAVIVYKEGALDNKRLDQFRLGMLKANKSERGREMMLMWRITSFEPVPADFQQTIDDILKVYPGPEVKVSMN